MSTDIGYLGDDEMAYQAAATIGGSSFVGREPTRYGKYAVRQYHRAVVPDKLLRDVAEAAYTKPASIQGYTLVTKLSTPETSVYVNRYSREAIIGVRGTANFSDVITDVSVARGTVGSTARYARTERDISKAKASLSGYNIAITGHSLGGTLVNEYSARQNNMRSAGFNSGYAVPWRKQTRGDRVKDRDYVEYLNRNDLVSVGALFRGKRSYQRRYSNGRYFLGAHKARPSVWRA